jgi:hypothetical protein
MRLNPDDPRISWHGAVSLEQGPGWIRPWRIPFDQRLLFGKLTEPDKLLSHARMPAGVRIAFFTDSETIGWDLAAIQNDPVQAQAARIDICCDGERHRSVPLLDGPSRCDLPSGEKLVEIWLPQYCEVLFRGFDLDEQASLRPFHDVRPRLLFYGSSNTQSKGAESPVSTWPAVFARHHDLNLMNLGYGSACHLDPMLARLMRDLPADLIAMEVGINIYINAALNAVSLRAAFVGFVQILREGHFDTPIIVMSSIYADWRESTPNAVGLTLDRIREELAAAVDDLRALGDGNLHYVSGLELFGADMADMLPDQLHPGVDGHKALGERFATRVGETIRALARS